MRPVDDMVGQFLPQLIKVDCPFDCAVFHLSFRDAVRKQLGQPGDVFLREVGGVQFCPVYSMYADSVFLELLQFCVTRKGSFNRSNSCVRCVAHRFSSTFRLNCFSLFKRALQLTHSACFAANCVDTFHLGFEAFAM
jgi:hypothetical protein